MPNLYVAALSNCTCQRHVFWLTMKCLVINIHGGAFMLGSSRMVNMDQIRDCLGRGWVVLAPNHRLCPQVDLLEGPMQDCRDLLSWVYEGGLERAISAQLKEPPLLDLDHVFAFGTSSGGTLALSLVRLSTVLFNQELVAQLLTCFKGFGVPRPVAGIVDMYGPCNFAHSFWTSELPHVAAKLPQDLKQDFLRRVYDESPVPIEGGVSLEGQAQGPPDFSDPRQAFALTQIANGNVMSAVFPSKDWDHIDPLRNISADFPPTFIIHGEADTMVPKKLSRDLLQELKAHGVKCGMQEIPGEEHTFAARMKVGSQTWELQKRGFDFLQGLL